MRASFPPCSFGQNPVKWPHQCAREAGRRGVVCAQEKSQGFSNHNTVLPCHPKHRILAMRPHASPLPHSAPTQSSSSLNITTHSSPPWGVPSVMHLQGPLLYPHSDNLLFLNPSGFVCLVTPLSVFPPDFNVAGFPCDSFCYWSCHSNNRHSMAGCAEGNSSCPTSQTKL